MFEQPFLGANSNHAVICIWQLDGFGVGGDCYFSYKKVSAELLNHRYFKLPHTGTLKHNPFDLKNLDNN